MTESAALRNQILRKQAAISRAGHVGIRKSLLSQLEEEESRYMNEKTSWEEDRRQQFNESIRQTIQLRRAEHLN